MNKPSKKEYPQYQAQNRYHYPLKPCQNLIQRTLYSLSDSEERKKFKNKQYYQKLIDEKLRPNLRHRVYFSEIKNGIWQLWVSNSKDAYALRFLLPLLSEELGKHLPKAPKLAIRIEPMLWKIIPQTRKKIHYKKAREFTPEEAKKSVLLFLERLNKN